METKVFATEEDAKAWMYGELAGEDCFDDYRFAFDDDENGMEEYEEIRKMACCGNSDFEVTIDGRKANIGTSYGH